MYEASHWGTREEFILDEALAFTTSNLESLVVSQSCPDHLREYIGHALEFPYHKGMPRLEARQYISYYEKDESRSDLVERIKHSFKISTWETETRGEFLHSSCSQLAALFEPHFTLSRNVLSKWCMAFTLLDDTYDSYGLFEELQQLTKAMESKDAMDELQGDYLKSIYETVLNIVGT
ncbi:hypothetical protein V6N13_039267 [Hibiscus sabdariffa]|uniref:Terpene synthase metal-binding domain-containing protein n=1 Tax=Hibiscus sabdariffa TaxID=183260 RepID=A0ABR2SWV4_9ROSI